MPSTTITETKTAAGRHWDIQTVYSDDERAEMRSRSTALEAGRSAAVTAAVAKIEAAATRAQITVTKSRARGYLKHPGKLNAIRWNLSQAEPSDGLRIVERLYREEPRSGGFIDIPCTNLAAARVAFRWARRHERAADRALMLAAE
jgi:hypothetical protein